MITFIVFYVKYFEVRLQSNNVKYFVPAIWVEISSKVLSGWRFKIFLFSSVGSMYIRIFPFYLIITIGLTEVVGSLVYFIDLILPYCQVIFYFCSDKIWYSPGETSAKFWVLNKICILSKIFHKFKSFKNITFLEFI